MKLKTIILSLIFLATFAAKAICKDSLMFHNVSHRIMAEIRPTYNLPTHGYYNGFNEANEPIHMGGAVHLKYGFTLSPDSKLGQLYPTSYQGIGIGAQSFLHHSMTGTPLMLYVFQGSPLVDLGKSVTIGYEWNLGASYGWKINDVVSSRWNIYINVGIPVTWNITPTWALSIAPEYTHFSNGDTSFPNGGANTVGCRIGVTAKINEEQEIKAPGKELFAKEEYFVKSTAKDRMSYDLTISAGWRADRTFAENTLHIINKPFVTSGVCFNPLYKFNRYFSAGPALDILYDSSADLEITDGQITYPKATRQLSAGLSARGELTMAFFAVNIGAGYGFSHGNDLRGFYTTYALKTFITDSLFINVGYRLSSVLYSHNLMFGVGVRL